MHNYEIVYIIDPTEKAVEQVEKKLVDLLIDAKNLKISHWGLKKFAYPIQKQTSGHYIQINCQLSAAVVAALPGKLNLVKPLLRYLIINLDNEKKFRYKERPPKPEVTLLNAETNQTKDIPSQSREDSLDVKPTAEKTVEDSKPES